ncbi:MAG: DNA mismatch repair protein MutS [Myxococcota bacterium]|nr:DNA mismatch repair protein MutS [Myxococcota bacterium]
MPEGIIEEQKPSWYGSVPLSASGVQTTMMKQFLELKSKVPEALLLFRMGDFYELFLEDARVAAHALELNLTSRNKKDDYPVPMAGIPYHALDNYLERLCAMGYKVALAEQEVDPNNPKRMIRKLTRMVTPGMPWGSDAIDARTSCWIAALCGTRTCGVAFLDSLTGELKCTELSNPTEAWAEIRRMQVKEVILDSRLAVNESIQSHLPHIVHSLKPPSYFDIRHGKRSLMQLLGVKDLTGVGAATLRPGIGAIGALLSYARDTAMISLTHIKHLSVYSVRGQMTLDEASMRNLEVLQPMRGTDKKHTLLGVMDKTRTAMGGRLLRQWLGAPLIDIKKIKRRQDAVEALLDFNVREPLREKLREVGDLERLSAKLAQLKINPRELLALGNSIYAVPSIMDLLSGVEAFLGFIPKELPTTVADEIFEYIRDDPAVTIKDGGVIRAGVNANLDEYTKLATEAKTAITEMEAKLKVDTSISSLKIKYNKVFGYFIEVSNANKDKVPKSWTRKQTLVNSERFITPELKEFEDKILNASEKMKALEYELFTSLRERLCNKVKEIQDLAKRIAFIDLLSTLAEVAVNQRYVRPVVDDSIDIQIIEGRHPVIETMDFDESFVPNSISMDAKTKFIMLTGPNMGGKSTVMRQTALIVLLAQIGSFVPAASAKIGLCDKIFVRVGASDDLARGRSTFMVEMGETALILNQATSRSLIMLDEIGRGTSTFDGLSIAWAVSEAIHDKLSSRTIFATHYHELTALAGQKEHMMNLHVAVSESRGTIVFLRELRPGSCGRSYGIQCAKLAGMPKTVIRRAGQVLKDLESKDNLIEQIDQLSIFDIPEQEEEPEAVIPPHLKQLETELRSIDLNELSPYESLKFLFELKAKLQTNSC